MFLADRHNDDRLLAYAWILLCSIAAFAAMLSWRAFTLPDASRVRGRSHDVRLAWVTASEPAGVDWSILRSGESTPRADAGSLATRFRLAGTFFAYAGGAKDQRKAVLDSLQTGRQSIVEENETVDGITVVKIYHDRVVLRAGSGKQEELWLGFSGKLRGNTGSAVTEPGTGTEGSTGRTRFGGKQVGKNSRIFQRAPLLAYYNELRAEPSRLYAVFDSMKPIYGDGRQIFGYQLQIEGEPELWRAAGLQQGDIVRKVNSVMMSNRRRAEHFISQFINDEANVFLLDIERDGQPLRLQYQMR